MASLCKRDRCFAQIPQVAPKSFVDPRTCLAVFNHYCYVSLLPTNSSRHQVDVSPLLAAVHHYRLCGFHPDVCRGLFNQTSFDDVMLTFQPRLRPAVDKVLSELNASTRRLPSTDFDTVLIIIIIFCFVFI